MLFILATERSVKMARLLRLSVRGELSVRPCVSSSRLVPQWACGVSCRSRVTQCHGVSLWTQAAPRSSKAEVMTAVSGEEPRPYTDIPGPRSWPLLGSLPSMFTSPAFDARRLPRLWENYFQLYGNIFKLSLPLQGDVVFISDPEDIETLYKKTFHNPVRPFFDSTKKVREMNKDQFFRTNETGLFTEQGEHWWRVRRLVQGHTMKTRTVAHYLPQMDQVANEFIARCAGQRDHNSELPGDFLKELFKWALESLCLVVFSRRMGCLENSSEGQHIITSSINMLEAVADCEFGFHWWRLFDSPAYKRLCRAHDDLMHVAMETVVQVQKELEARQPQDGTELNFLESLIMTPGLSFQDVVTYMIDLLTAGIDTTSLSTVFLMYHLARHPDKQARLQEELDQVLGDGRCSLTPQHLAKLSYTKACVRESLRVSSPAAVIARQPSEDVTLHGYSVPRGTVVYMSITESPKNEAYFPRASEFLPERWLRDEPDRVTVNQYTALPFSIGTRMCVGRRLAEQEMYIFMARLFHKYNLEYKYEPWNPTFKLLFNPDKPQNFTMTPRGP